MMRIVADASVAIKWLLPATHEEQDWGNALGLLQGVRSEQIHLVQPPHWLAEVAAVLTRLSPATAIEDISDLYAMDIPIVQSAPVYSTACKLSRELDHHLFDTLYHAVALSLDDAILVTADERYYKKASRRGRLVLLRDYSYRES
jgi:predicted nucleic acid-binding protein